MNWFLFASVIVWAVATLSVIGMFAIGWYLAECIHEVSRKAKRWSIFGLVTLTITAVLSFATIIGAGM